MNICDPALETEYQCENNTSKTNLIHKLQGRGSKKVSYIPEEIEKRFTIRFAIASGHEDDIGELLSHAGFWNNDYTSKDMWKDSISEQMDPMDMIVQYAVRVREKLISYWGHSERERGRNRSRKNFEQECREKFPFNRLIGSVCRDILFSALFMEEELDENMLPQKLEMLGEEAREKRMEKIYKCLILPVKEADTYWAEEVRNIIPKKYF